MDVKLVVASGSKAGQAIPVTVPKFFIGRAEDCHLKPRSELISRYHCAIVSEEGYVAVRDMQSKNGIFVNGERIGLEQELKNGDHLVIGPLEFTVQLLVTLKGEKKPKVESVKEAAERTVEVATGPSAKKEESEGDVSDWLMGDDDSDNQETKTIDLSRVREQEDLSETKQSGTDATDDTSKKRIDPPQKKQEANVGNSKDAAANMLKNFFRR